MKDFTHLIDVLLLAPESNLVTVLREEFGHTKPELPTIRPLTQKQRRLLRESAQGKGFTADEFTALCEAYGNVCLKCRAEDKLVADHIVPLARDGRHEIDNIQPPMQGLQPSKRIEDRRL